MSAKQSVEPEKQPGWGFWAVYVVSILAFGAWGGGFPFAAEQFPVERDWECYLSQRQQWPGEEGPGQKIPDTQNCHEICSERPAWWVWGRQEDCVWILKSPASQRGRRLAPPPQACFGPHAPRQYLHHQSVGGADSRRPGVENQFIGADEVRPVCLSNVDTRVCAADSRSVPSSCMNPAS